MAALCAKVELYDAEDRVIVTEYAYGNTKAAVDAAAGALRRSLENEYEESHPGCNGIISKTVKA
jgi:hypothetical protein